MMKVNISNLARACFYLFFVFVIFPVDALLWSKETLASGFFNPYLSHFIYLADVFLLLGLFFVGLVFIVDKESFFKRIKLSDEVKKLTILILLFIVASFLSLFFTSDIINSLFYLLKMLEFFVIYLLIVKNILDTKMIVYSIVGALTVSAFFGIYQYLNQESLGFPWLGEPILDSNMLGVAKLDFFDEKLIRAYGTFTHPNIFAAYLLFGILLLINLLKDAKGERKLLFSLLLVILGLAFILTFSRSAFLASLLAFAVYYFTSNIRPKWKHLLLAFVIFIFFIIAFDLFSLLFSRLSNVWDEGSFAERTRLVLISKKMFLDHPLGVGIGNFTDAMQQYSFSKLMPWDFQPVHTFYLLILNEIGIYGFISFLLLFGYLLKILVARPKGIFLAFWSFIFVVGFFDHYFISLYQGQMLFWLFFSISGRSLNV